MYYENVDAQREIRRRLSEGNVIIIDHAKDRMYERNISRSDVTKCLRGGVVVGSTFNDRHQEWRYKLTGKVTADEEVSIAVVLPDNCDDDIVVTVF